MQDMLKRSFSEFSSRKNEGKDRDLLHDLRKRVNNLQELGRCLHLLHMTYCLFFLIVYYNYITVYSQLYITYIITILLYTLSYILHVLF